MKTATHHYTRDRILRFIQHYCTQQGCAPSYHDIAVGVGTSRANVSYHVRVLENTGQLVRQSKNHSLARVMEEEGFDPSPVSVALQRAIVRAPRLETEHSLTPVLDALVVPLPPGTWMPRRQRRRRSA